MTIKGTINKLELNTPISRTNITEKTKVPDVLKNIARGEMAKFNSGDTVLIGKRINPSTGVVKSKLAFVANGMEAQVIGKDGKLSILANGTIKKLPLLTRMKDFMSNAKSFIKENKF